MFLCRLALGSHTRVNPGYQGKEPPIRDDDPMLGVGVLTAMPSWMQWVSTTVERSPLARVLGSAMILIRALSETGRAPLRTWLKVLAWSVVIQGVQLLTIAMVGMALGLVPALPGLLLAQGTGSLGILVGVILPGGLGTYEVAVISSFAGPGGLTLASAGVLAVGIRIVHLLGLGSAGIMFAFWAKVLTAGGLSPFGAMAAGGIGGGSVALQTVQPLDILIVQANANTLLSHFVSLFLSLFLTRYVKRLDPPSTED